VKISIETVSIKLATPLYLDYKQIEKERKLVFAPKGVLAPRLCTVDLVTLTPADIFWCTGGIIWVSVNSGDFGLAAVPKCSSYNLLLQNSHFALNGTVAGN
jgi:hypothetical protein